MAIKISPVTHEATGRVGGCQVPKRYVTCNRSKKFFDVQGVGNRLTAGRPEVCSKAACKSRNRVTTRYHPESSFILPAPACVARARSWRSRSCRRPIARPHHCKRTPKDGFDQTVTSFRKMIYGISQNSVAILRFGRAFSWRRRLARANPGWLRNFGKCSNEGQIRSRLYAERPRWRDVPLLNLPQPRRSVTMLVAARLRYLQNTKWAAAATSTRNASPRLRRRNTMIWYSPLKPSDPPQARKPRPQQMHAK